MSGLTGVRILYVEDDPGAARLLQKRLGRRGLLVDLAADGEDGLLKWSEGTYDLLAVDHDMPRLTGLELIRILAAERRLPPTIMITGAGNEDIAVEAMKLGAADYIMKDPGARYLDLVPRVIEQALERDREREEKRRAEERLQWESRVNAALAELYIPVISTSCTIAEIADTVLEKAKTLTGSRDGFVAEVDRETGDVVSHTLTRMMEEGCKLSAERRIIFPKGPDGIYPKLWGHCLNTREPFFTNEPNGHPRSTGLPEGHVPITSFLSVPVVWGDELVGQIAVANSERNYTNHDLEAVKRLAAYYAMGIRRARAEEGLRQQKELLETILANAPVMVAFLDADGRHKWVNRCWQETLGWSLEEAQKRDVLADFYPDSEYCARVRENIRAASGAWGDFKTRTRERGVLDTLWVHVPLSDGSNIGIGIDVTERKRAEQALAREKERLLVTLRSIGDGVISTDSQGTVLSVNAVAEQLTGWSEESAFGRPLDEVFKIINEKSRQLLENPVRKVLRTGMIADLANHTVLVAKDGTERILADSGAPIKDQTGNIIGVVLVFRDVTEHQRAADALRESELWLRSLFNAMPDPMLVLTPGRVVKDFNAAAGHVFGYSREEVVGRSAELFHMDNEHYVKAGKRLAAAFARGERARFDLVVKRKTGELFPVEAVVSLLTDPDKRPLGILTLLRDISPRRQSEARLLQTRRMEAIGSLAGGIAHELNNLLQVVHGYAEMVLHKIGDDQPGHSELLVIKEAAGKATQLTQGLLTFSRKEASSLRPVDVNKELLNMTPILTRTLPETVRIEMDLAEELPSVKADPAQLQQVVINLVVNAGDAMPEGGHLVVSTGTARLEQRCRTAGFEALPGEYVLISVRDTGTGMDQETVRRIFDPCVRTKDEGKGAGLGLSIVYGIVKNHRGLVRCESKPGKGTTFLVYLPAASKEPRAESLNQTDHLSRGSKTVLLIDGEHSVRATAERMLRTFGMKVLTASDGQEGLEVFARERSRIDLIILDPVMPNMGGMACLRGILGIDPAARVVITGGYQSNGQVDRALGEGAKASLHKPFAAGELLEVVRRVLDE
ncbi:MAG: PAS domain S-box protein [Thermodesulfobacteriota bacterium]